jgi:hypothetical protein
VLEFKVRTCSKQKFKHKQKKRTIEDVESRVTAAGLSRARCYFADDAVVILCWNLQLELCSKQKFKHKQMMRTIEEVESRVTAAGLSKAREVGTIADCCFWMMYASNLFTPIVVRYSNDSSIGSGTWRYLGGSNLAVNNAASEIYGMFLRVA